GPLASRLRAALPGEQPPTDLVLVAGGGDVGAQIQALAQDDVARRWLVHERDEIGLRGAFAALALDRPDSAASAIELLDRDEASIARLLAELEAGGAEARVRLAAGTRQVARLLSRKEPLPEAPPVRADGLYVIAGGQGML